LSWSMIPYDFWLPLQFLQTFLWSNGDQVRDMANDFNFGWSVILGIPELSQILIVDTIYQSF
jgi:hypothetical protein